MEGSAEETILYKLGINARKIVEGGKGILAADETPANIGRKFERYGIENSFETRKRFREILIETPGIAGKIGGVILPDEIFTYEDGLEDGKGSLVARLVSKGISPGIKLDKGLIDFKHNEKVSVGLEDLEKRCKMKAFGDAEFAKWRSVFIISENTPTPSCVRENCSVLARYAASCQKEGIVPIVEPEILWDGEYTIDSAYRISNIILSALINQLNVEQVYIPGVLIKPSFITPGKNSKAPVSYNDVSYNTFNSLMNTMPCGIPGIVFLSGGHSPDDAMEYLNSLNREKGARTWKMSFSYGRALTDPVLEAWGGREENVSKAQDIFIKQVEKAFLAAQGKLHEPSRN